MEVTPTAGKDMKVKDGISELHTYTNLVFSDYMGSVENDLKNVRMVLTLLERQLSPESDCIALRLVGLALLPPAKRCNLS